MRHLEIPTQIEDLTLFPLKDHQKIPSVKWREYNNKDFVKNNNPETYGIDCDRSHIVVIDVDNHDGTNTGLHEWEKILLENQDIPSTFSVLTPNNGFHFYFLDTTEGEIKNSAGQLAPSIDVRANGGYVVGPNSTIIDEDGNKKVYSVFDNDPIRPLPDSLRKMILDAKTTKNNNNNSALTKNDSVDNKNSDSETEELIVEAQKRIITAKNGERNDTLNKEVFHLVQEGIDPEVVKNKLTGIALAIGLSDEEIQKTIASATLKGLSINKKTKKSGKNIEDSATFYFTDLIMATRMKDVLLEEQYRYVDWDFKWRQYNDTTGVWEEVSDAKILSRISQWCREEVRKAANGNDADFIKASMRCLNKYTSANVHFFAKLKCLIDNKVFDKHPDKIVVQNGVVNLRTKKLTPFDPELYLTKRINIPYDPTVKSQYLDMILDALPQDTGDWFMKMAGQSLTGYHPTSDIMIFLKGNGSNGKSTILNLLTATAGEYGGLPPQSCLVKTRNGGDNFNLVSFKGLRQGVIEELPDKQLDTVRMKLLTGTEYITARGLYKDNETFKVESTIWVSCNILPQVIEYDHGTWRRIVLVEFDKTYKSKKSDVVMKNDRLGNSHVREASLHDKNTHIEFLARRIEGAYQWFKRGYDPDLPKSVEESTQKWKDSGDNIRIWFNECLNAEPNSFCLNEDLRDSYNNWLENHGYSTLSHKVFLDRIENHDLFSDGKIQVIKKRRVSVLLNHSSWRNPKNNTMREVGKSLVGHTTGISFK